MDRRAWKRNRTGLETMKLKSSDITYFENKEAFIEEAVKFYSQGHRLEQLVVFGELEPSDKTVDDCLAGLKNPDTGETVWLDGFEKFEYAMGTAGELIDFAYRYGQEILAKIDDEPEIVDELYNDAMGYYHRKINAVG